MNDNLNVHAFFDEPTNTISYLVWDKATGRAAVIDPVLDFDLPSGRVDVASADRILAAAKERKLAIERVLETHAHADHLSAAPYIKRQTGALTGIGKHICEVQKIFGPVFGFGDMKPDGADFDELYSDGDCIALGELVIEVLHVPGHTPADVAYRIDDTVFVGDTLFMPDYGTARADFPGGDARELYRSIRRILALPDETRLFMCHDYKAPNRDRYAWETTVADQKANSVHVGEDVSEDEFIAMRTARDERLPVPKLLLPAVQVNIRAGNLPEADDGGAVYLRIPITQVERA